MLSELLESSGPMPMATDFSDTGHQIIKNHSVIYRASRIQWPDAHDECFRHRPPNNYKITVNVYFYGLKASKIWKILEPLARHEMDRSYYFE